MADDDFPIVAHFDVHRRSYLAPDGTMLRKMPEFVADIPTLISLYRAMVLTRTFDLKAVSLQRTGRLGTYAVSLGQEAVSVGVASAMRPRRRAPPLLPRQRHAALARREDGGDPALLGRRRARQSLVGPGARLSVLRSGRLAGAPRGRRRLRLEVPQGAARRGVPARRRRDLEGRRLRGDEFRRRPEAAARVRRQQQPMGDLGAAQAADGVARRWRRRPSPRASRASRSTATTSLRCATAVEQAIAAARSGQGPRLIEALTYRLGDHTTADDAARYRPPEEVQAHWKEEPIARLRAYLVGQKAWGKAEEEQLRRMPGAASRRPSNAIWPRARARRRPCSITSMPSSPSAYASQRDELKERAHG